MKKFLFFIATALLLFIIDVSPGSAGEPLKIKWKRNNVSLERICRPGKLVVVSDLSGIEYLIELINGEIIYQTDPSKDELGIYINFNGDKFYVYVINKGKIEAHEFDTKTKQYIRTIQNADVPMSPLDESGWYYVESKSFKIFNTFTRELIDSIYYPVPFSVKGQGGNAFTVDNKYFLFTLYTITSSKFVILAKS